MPNYKYAKHLPFAIATLAALALAVSNIQMRRDLRRWRAKDAAPSADAAKVEREAVAQQARERERASTVAQEELSNIPFTATSISQYYDEGYKITFSDVVIPPEGDEAENALSVEPPVGNLGWSRNYWGGIVMTGDFEPDRVYTVTVNPVWRSFKGATMKKPARLTFQARKAKPNFTFSVVNKSYWPARREALRFPYSTVAVTNLEVRVRRAYESNIPIFGMGDYRQEASSMEIVSTNVPVAIKGEVWRRQEGFIDVGALIGKAEPGLYFVDVHPNAAYSHDGWWMYDGERSLSFSLTDMAITFAGDEREGTKAVVAVNSFATGEPVAGAEVALYTEKYQLAARGVTDESGMALLDFVIDDPGDAIGRIAARKGGDVSVLDLPGGGNRLADVGGNAKGESSKAMAYVFSERELCRPGESFGTLAFVRGPLKDGAMALANAPVELILKDAGGNVAGRRRLTTDESGFVSTEWDVPRNAGLGVWNVVCSVGDTLEAGKLGVRIANYVPDRFSVGMETSFDEAIGLDEPLTISGEARYYFDEPLAEGDCRISAIAVPGYEPKHWKGWHVGEESALNCGEWKTGADLRGDGTFSAVYPGLASNGVANVFAPVGLVVGATVQEPGGNAVSAVGNAVYHPTSRYIGLCEREDEPASFDVALLPALEKDAVSNDAPVTVSFGLEREVWTRHFEKSANGAITAEWRSEMVALSNLSHKVEIPAGDVTGWRGLVRFAQDGLPAGHYRLTATDGGSLRTSFGFWHWSGEAGERSSNPASIYFESGAEKYAPGDIATIKFASPFAGQAFVMAGVADIGVSFAAAVTQGLNSVSLEIPSSLLASRYYAAVTVVSQDGGESRRAFGVAEIKVDASASRKLSVGLSLPDVALPSSECEMEVSLADANGGPVQGEVAVVAIDEGVAALTNYRLKDPFLYFFARDLHLPFGVFDSYNRVFPDLRIMPDGTIGGDGVDGAVSARNLDDSVLKGKATARLVAPPVRVGADGKAKFSVALPNHTGAMRFFAVAASDKAAGICDGKLTMRNPVSIEAGAPRFATAGDSFRLGVTLFSHDGSDGEFRFEAQLPEGMSAEDGSSRITFRAKPNGAKSVSKGFMVRVSEDASGPMDMAMRLSQDGRSVADALTVNVQAPRPAASHTGSWLVTDGERRFRVESSNWVGRATTTLTVSASPSAMLATSLDWLGRYPYGCLEQTISCAFPFVGAGDLEALGLINADGRAAAKAKVALAYAEILQMRSWNGDFGMWPWSSESWEYGTLLASHFMFEAEKAGMVTIGGDLRGSQIKRLRDMAQVQAGAKRGAAAYAAYSLAVAGDIGFVNAARNLIDASDSDFAAFLAAAAMLRGGYASEGIATFEKAIDARVWENDDPWRGTMDAGMALFIAAKTGYGDLGRLAPAVERLAGRMRDDDSAWGTTRDNGWACLGLAAYAARLGSTGTSGTVVIGGETFAFDAAMKPVKFDLPSDTDVTLRGDGPLFAVVTTAGVPAHPAAGGRIGISRQYLDGAGNEVTRVKRGDLVTVVVEVVSPSDIENAVLVDLVPGGFEIEDGSFVTRTTLGAYRLPDNVLKLGGRKEFRNDRCIWYGQIGGGDGGARPRTLSYAIRAMFPGKYRLRAAMVEDMYDPDMAGRLEVGDGAVIEVE